MAINLPIVSKFYDQGVKNAESSLKKFGAFAAKSAAAATAAIGAIAVVSVKAFGDFDAALNKSISIMGNVSDTLRTEMSDAAREVAKATTFSAEEAAEAYFFLASAGLDAEASIAAMPQVAKFAQAGMFDMATATDLATDAQSALGSNLGRCS
jgi:TP901 family phage tail tape measure protein